MRFATKLNSKSQKVCKLNAQVRIQKYRWTFLSHVVGLQAHGAVIVAILSQILENPYKISLS
jgi:hypothetical protein